MNIKKKLNKTVYAYVCCFWFMSEDFLIILSATCNLNTIHLDVIRNYSNVPVSWINFSWTYFKLNLNNKLSYITFDWLHSYVLYSFFLWRGGLLRSGYVFDNCQDKFEKLKTGGKQLTMITIFFRQLDSVFTIS